MQPNPNLSRQMCIGQRVAETRPRPLVKQDIEVELIRKGGKQLLKFDFPFEIVYDELFS